jgi:hypothetical protein
MILPAKIHNTSSKLRLFAMPAQAPNPFLFSPARRAPVSCQFTVDYSPRPSYHKSLLIKGVSDASI